MKYEFSYGFSGPQTDTRILANDQNYTVFEALNDNDDAGYWVDFRLNAPIKDTYIMLPACAYDGNRFRSATRTYPPMFTEEEFGHEVPTTMTGVPRLCAEGDSFMDVTTGDLASPYVCIFNKTEKEAFILNTQQDIDGLNLGITLEQTGDELLIRLRAPAKRRLVYRWLFGGMPDLYEIPDADPEFSVSKGKRVEIKHQTVSFHCDSIGRLHERLFDMRFSHVIKHHNTVLPYSAFWKLSEDRANEIEFIEGENFYRLPSFGDKQWQAGWVGGGMNTLALIGEGTALSRQRAIQTLEFAARYQTDSGWYYGIVHESKVIHDCFDYHGDKHSLVMVRKHADLTYFMWKQINVLDRLGIEYPASIKKSALKATDALIKLWDNYGQLGQFVNAETGEIKVGSSEAGGIVPAALCAGYAVTGNADYLKYACDIGRFFYKNAVSKGVTTGGPGEILSAPDSESCAALLESYVALYEFENSSIWLDYARDAAHQLSTWVVDYEYRFPEGSKFDRLGINSCGSVWANVQNKHSAPGLCTLSPASLFKLYRFTGERKYLEFAYIISNFMPQVVSTPERPIYRTDGVALMPGEMCERVNLSDWEGREGIGDSIFGSSSWPEVSLMLTWLEMPGVYVDIEKELVCVNDNVEAWLEDGRLIINNPTGYDATVKVMVEKDISKKLGLWWQDVFTKVHIGAGKRSEVSL